MVDERVVLVMSGGASRGAAQVGMLKALLRRGVVPDHLVGSSVGALNAAYLACDPTLERAESLHERWSGLTGRTIFPGGTLTRVRHLVRRRPYLFGSHGLAGLVGDWVPHARLEDLPTPLRVVTSELGSGRPTYHDRGDLRDVLLASTALPAVFAPVPLPDPVSGGTSLHIDGGITDNVPLAGAVDLAPTTVYVLNVSPPLRPRAPRNPVDVLVMSLGVSMRLRPQVDLGPDVRVVDIEFSDLHVPMTDFTQTDALVAAGERAADEVLDRLEQVEPVAPPAPRAAAGRLLPLRRRRVRASAA